MVYNVLMCLCRVVQYAWFNGVDPKAMREVDDEEVIAVGAEMCVEWPWKVRSMVADTMDRDRIDICHRLVRQYT